VYLQSLEAGAQKAIASVDPGVSVIRWSGDGRHLFLLKRGGSARESVLRLDTENGRAETWRELKVPDPIAAFFQSVVLSADGQAYAFSYQRDLATLYLVNGVD